MYGNLVHARGYRRFCRDAVAAGASSLLVPDVPLEEGAPLTAACREESLGVVQLRERPGRARIIGASATVVGVALIARFGGCFHASQ